LQQKKCGDNDYHLLCGALSGLIYEVDLCGNVVNRYDSYGGAVWALKTHPVDHGTVAVACEDGCVRLFRHDSMSSLILSKVLSKQKGMSLLLTGDRSITAGAPPHSARRFARVARQRRDSRLG
jgi:hypothetical protein